MSQSITIDTEISKKCLNEVILKTKVVDTKISQKKTDELDKPIENKYNDSIIYKLTYKNDETQFFIGKTTNLKKSIMKFNDKNSSVSKSNVGIFVEENGGIDEFKLEILEFVECESLEELFAYRLYYILKLKPTLQNDKTKKDNELFLENVKDDEEEKKKQKYEEKKKNKYEEKKKQKYEEKKKQKYEAEAEEEKKKLEAETEEETDDDEPIFMTEEETEEETEELTYLQKKQKNCNIQKFNKKCEAKAKEEKKKFEAKVKAEEEKKKFEAKVKAEEEKKILKEEAKKRALEKKKEKHDCNICGGKYTTSSKSTHFKSKTHQKFQDIINLYSN
jgi:hypothetical protein